jgi:hypothetical protein
MAASTALGHAQAQKRPSGAASKTTKGQTKKATPLELFHVNLLHFDFELANHQNVIIRRAAAPAGEAQMWRKAYADTLKRVGQAERAVVKSAKALGPKDRKITADALKNRLESRGEEAGLSDSPQARRTMGQPATRDPSIVTMEKNAADKILAVLDPTP